MYQFGKGVPQDYPKAVEWYLKAANQGYAEAQYRLGFMYESGEGVPEDDSKSIEWFEKAAKQGHAGAQKRLDTVRHLMRKYGLLD